MKSNYTSVWLLISVALVIVLAVSFLDDITIGEWTLKKAPFRENLLAEKLQESNSGMGTDSVAAQASSIEQPVDSTSQSIFIFGDSMTLNLAYRLAAYAKQNGHTLNAVNWDSSNTKIWAESDTLDYFIRKFNPTQIFIALGSNELYLRKPESRIPYLKKILEKIDKIPYVWIGPPSLKYDYGMNDIIASETAPGSFFLSSGLDLKRKKDNIHPTRDAAALLIDSVMRWLPKSSHPFVADFPADSLSKSSPNVIFLKALNK